MNPEVVAAIGVLREKAILSDTQAARLLPVARRELVSVRLELRTLLYAGVLLAVSGVGLFLKQNHDRIGPAVIASLLTAAAVACFAYVFLRSPPFSWGASASAHVATDYVLLLGVLLVGSDLAYIETQFRFLGADWAQHLLVLSLVALAAAYRFDSRVVLSLALSSFAAWRGLSTRLPLESVFSARPDAVRANALGCGALFLVAALVSVRAKKKAHFEAVYSAFGWVLLFSGLLSGVFQGGADWPLWDCAACLAAAAVVVFAYRSRRIFDFAVAVVALYLALLRPLWKAVGETGEVFLYVVAVSSLAVLVLLTIAYKAMRRPE
jgi:hypothetical protein